MVISVIKNYKDLNEIKSTGFAKEIINNIKTKTKNKNIYEKLLDEKTLSYTELKDQFLHIWYIN